MKRSRPRSGIVALAAGLAVFASGSFTGAHAADPADRKPLRRGSIVGGYFTTGGTDCGFAPDCRAWLATGCNPSARVVGEPALVTSIVDVQDLAGQSQRRAFTTVLRKPGFGPGWVVLEFWDGRCTHSPIPFSGGTQIVVDCSDTVDFTVPADARWMTVASGDCTYLDWSLT